MLLRANALNEQASRMKFADERNELVMAIENIIAACREAKKQGRPDDPKTFEHIRAMRDKHVLLPGSGIQAGNYSGSSND